VKARRQSKLLFEPPASATGDIAFNLIVFFLVCASVQPDSGRKQTLPRSEEQAEQQESTKNIEVRITRLAAMVNGDTVRIENLGARLKRLLTARPRPEDRVVVVKSTGDTPYRHWIQVTEAIETAGGVITIQTEEEKQVVVGQ
jgi:biopolymer transport protein ExbD